MRRMRWLGLVFGLLLVVTACGSSSKGSASAGEATSTTAAKAAAATVKVATSAKYGKMLVDADGRSLYLFEKDQGTTSACTGACADNWPALKASSPVAGGGLDQSKLTTAGGQVVYGGHLLYRFAGDKAPGDVNGAGIPSWYPVSPAGEKIDKD